LFFLVTKLKLDTNVLRKTIEPDRILP
jgi:hypothetical protein